MTPEQFDALVQMVSAMIDARTSQYGGQQREIAFQRSDEMIAEARKLFVVEPASEIAPCSHSSGKIRRLNFQSFWSCCGESFIE